MPARIATTVTAMFPMAVLYVALLLTGCATPRMVDELKAQVGEVESQNRQTQAMVARVDSVMAEESEANRRLRNEMNVTISDLQRQIATLQESNNDLLQRIETLLNDLNRRGILYGSPGTRPPAGQTTTVTQRPSIDCEATYDEAFILVRRGEYEKAIAGFQIFLSECGTHELAENAYYWTGECYYSLEQYEQAIEQFDHLITNYRSSVNASRAMYKLGRCRQELGETEEAKKVFRKVVDEYPGTLEAEQAQERLKDLQ